MLKQANELTRVDLNNIQSYYQSAYASGAYLNSRDATPDYHTRLWYNAALTLILSNRESVEAQLLKANQLLERLAREGVRSAQEYTRG